MSCPALSGQGRLVGDKANGLIMESLDPVADSLAIAAMREKMAQIRKTRPTVAVVLSGGGAKGAAHVGALRYLEEKGIPVDMITGTSMGGLIGGMYAMGYSAGYLDTLLRSVDWKVMMSDRIDSKYYSYEKRKEKDTYLLSIPFHYADADWDERFGSKQHMKSTDIVSSSRSFANNIPEGYLYGLNVMNMLSSLSVGYQDTMKFKDLPIPFFCVAADALTMKEKNWTEGLLLQAMRSTMSIPVYFKPVRLDDGVFVDGGTLNNYPVDLARSMGADIVIGVHFYIPPTRETTVNALEIVMNSMDGASNETFRKNVEAVDVNIHPDMTDYGMLSFGEEEIDHIISLGYEAAVCHSDELDSILVRLGNFEKAKRPDTATDISKKPVLISEVVFEGLTDAEAKYFQNKIRIHAGSLVTKEDIEKAVAILYSSGSFNQVIYHLYNDEEPYSCHFDCGRGPLDQFSLGLRLDTQESIAAIFNLGLRKNKIWGHSLDIGLKIGLNPALRLEYKYTPVTGAGVGAFLKTGFTGRLGGEPLFHFNFDDIFWRNEAGAFFDAANLRHFNFRIGAKVVNTPYRHFRNNDVSVEVNDWNSAFSYAFLNLAFTHLDDSYFPDKGVDFAVNYHYMLSGKYEVTNSENTGNQHFLGFHIRAAIPLCDRLVLEPRFDGRGASFNNCQDSYMNNHVGGFLRGRYYDNQIPFMGITSCIDVERFVAVADVELRYNVAGNHYVSAKAATCQDWDDEINIWNERWALGIQYGFKSIVGPIIANFNWSDRHRLAFYLGVGFDF